MKNLGRSDGMRPKIGNVVMQDLTPLFRFFHKRGLSQIANFLFSVPHIDCVLAISFGLFFFYQLFDSRIDLPSNELLLLDICMFAALPIFTLILWTKHACPSWFVLNKKNVLRTFTHISSGALLGVAFVGVYTAFYYSNFHHNLSDGLQSLDAHLSNIFVSHTNSKSKTESIGFQIYAALSAGLAEEFYYKYVLFVLISRRLGMRTFVLVSVLLFSVVHIEKGVVLAFLGIGVLYGLPTTIYYAYQKKLFPLIVVHVVSDLIFFLR